MTELRNYVVFDLETTGLSKQDDEIIEIAAVKVKDHCIVDKFSCLINPGIHIPALVSRLTGITNDMVKGKYAINMVLPSFVAFTESLPLVGHNIKTFDMHFLKRDAMRYYHATIPNPVVDTLPMSRAYLPDLSSHKLTSLAEYYNISSAGAHRSLNDCIMNQAVFELLQNEALKHPKELCPICGATLVKRAGKYGPFMGCSNFPKCRYTKEII